MGNQHHYKYKIGLAIAVMLVVAIIYMPSICAMRWSGTGYDTKYSWFSGCLVKQSSGKWLPEDKVRPE